jgi:hypothetical protein
MVSTIPPVHILGNTVIISTNQFMNNDLIYLILKCHVIAAHFYPFPPGVAAGGGAGGRLDEPRPDLAAGLLHLLPQEPHRRMFERGADALDAVLARHGAPGRGDVLLGGGLGLHADARGGAAAANDFTPLQFGYEAGRVNKKKILLT